MKAAGDNRYGHRDATMILLAFRRRSASVRAVLATVEQVASSGRLHA